MSSLMPSLIYPADESTGHTYYYNYNDIVNVSWSWDGPPGASVFLILWLADSGGSSLNSRSNVTVLDAGNGSYLSSLSFTNLQYPLFGHFNILADFNNGTVVGGLNGADTAVGKNETAASQCYNCPSMSSGSISSASSDSISSASSGSISSASSLSISSVSSGSIFSASPVSISSASSSSIASASPTRTTISNCATTLVTTEMPMPSSPSMSPGGGLSSGAIAGIIVGVIVAVAIAGFYGFFNQRRRRGGRTSHKMAPTGGAQESQEGAHRSEQKPELDGILVHEMHDLAQPSMGSVELIPELDGTLVYEMHDSAHPSIDSAELDQYW